MKSLELVVTALSTLDIVNCSTLHESKTRTEVVSLLMLVVRKVYKKKL